MEFTEEEFCTPSVITFSDRSNDCEGVGKQEGGATIFSHGEKIWDDREGSAEEPTEGFSAGN